MKAIGVVGATGLIGGIVMDALCSVDSAVRAVPIARIEAEAPPDPVAPSTDVSAWRRANPDAWRQLTEELCGLDVVVVAAGAAEPDSADELDLAAANALLPWLVATAADEAGVRRLVHISSAAVQGESLVLDESASVAPFSAYSQSKAAGEAGLRRLAEDTGLSLAIYRPTTVIHPDRSVSRSLIRLAGRRWMPLGPGIAPLPLAHPRNVGAVVKHLVMAPDPPSVTIHPSEEMSLESLRLALGRPAWSFARSAMLFGLVHQLVLMAARVRSNPGLMRRLNLLREGQRTAPATILTDGYSHPAAHDEWRQLVASVREAQKMRPRDR